MAIITAGSIVGQVSGRLASVVYSHNKGGPYARNGTIPTNPNTTYQQALRAALANTSQAWAGLTDAQRLSWKLWAEVNPVVNRLGRKIQMTGHQSYLQINTRLYWKSLPTIAIPPIASPPTPLATVTLTADIGLGGFEVAFTATPTGATEYLWVQACLVNNPGIMHIENLLRMVVMSGAAETSPFDIEPAMTARFGTLQVGQTCYVRVSVFDSATGLISSGLQDSAVVVTT